MTTEPDTLRALVDELGELRSTLDDLNVRHVTVSPSGAWTFEKLGRTRSGEERLDGDTVRELAEATESPGASTFGDWSVRAYRGVNGHTLFFERLPSAVAERLPEAVLERLQEEIRHGGNGVVIGPPRAGKGAILLWLAMQIPGESVIFVSENPPAELPGAHVTHLFPPASEREHRDLERLIRLSGTVMWDRVATPRDLRTVSCFAGAGHRWFTLDASSLASGLRTLRGARRLGCDARFSNLLALDSSVIGRPEVTNLVVREEGEWAEPFAADGSCLDQIAAFDGDREVAPPIAPEKTAETTRELVNEETAERAPSPPPEAHSKKNAPKSGIRKRPGEVAEEFDSPMTVPVEVDSEAAVDDEADTPSEIPRLDPDDDARESGEIDLEPYLERRERKQHREDANKTPVTEETRQYIDAPEEIAARLPDDDAEGREDDDSLNELLPGLEFEEGDQRKSMNLDDLRITRIEQVSEEELEELEKIREESTGAEDDEIDFEHLADNSDISEAETSVASGDISEAYRDSDWSDQAAAEDETIRNVVISDEELQTSPTMAANPDELRQAAEAGPDGQDATEEVTMNHRRMNKIRRAKKEKEEEDD